MKALKCLGSLLATVMICAALPAFAEDSGSSLGSGSDGKSWNISTNPLALIVGPNLALDYKVADQWTVGVKGDFILFNLGTVHMNGGGIGVQSTYYFNHVFQRGWFANAGVDYSVLKAKYAESDGTEDSASLSQVSIPVIGGYKWFWGNFNLSLGLGPVVNFRSTNEIKDQAGNDVKSLGSSVGVAGDASLGWTF